MELPLLLLMVMLFSLLLAVEEVTVAAFTVLFDSPRVGADVSKSVAVVSGSCDSVAAGLKDGEESTEADENESSALGLFLTGPRVLSSISHLSPGKSGWQE